MRHFSKSIGTVNNRLGREVGKWLNSTSTVTKGAATNQLKGVWPIVATPFHAQNEKLDYKSFEKILSFFCNEIKVSGVTVMGVLGESNRLLDKERTELTKIAVSVCQETKTPVCVGTSHSGTYATIERSLEAFDLGCYAVMISPSKETFTNQKVVYNYFKEICKHLSAERQQWIVLQDHPQSTEVKMELETIESMVQDFLPIACIKLESLPSPTKIKQLQQFITKNVKREVTLLGGLGALYGYFDLQSLSDGFMTGFAFPEILQAMYLNARNSDKCFQIYAKYLPLIVFEQQPGVSLRKHLYHIRGLLADTHVRHPGPSSSVHMCNCCATPSAVYWS
ncbi:putative dihydrodipicolinate synthase [Reticulomyxa filosa]|uniref:Putative dihydrodipicolinate synthase n=1 Tax=Reticulomyxa filosa TaxID=46433 RepID=X6P8L2_RETFI|nr:putative dihydrodipicolinate synthase [Reticulomyxa filosa]|eukprot:ETO34384.1 putative dihydrodipicolinate synthase [Reticulomyxa filosa]